MRTPYVGPPAPKDMRSTVVLVDVTATEGGTLAPRVDLRLSPASLRPGEVFYGRQHLTARPSLVVASPRDGRLYLDNEHLLVHGAKIEALGLSDDFAKVRVTRDDEGMYRADVILSGNDGTFVVTEAFDASARFTAKVDTGDYIPLHRYRVEKVRR